MRKSCLTIFFTLIFVNIATFSSCQTDSEINHNPSMPTKIRIGIASMISPKETIYSYKKILNYVAEELGIEIEMVQRKTYAEMDDLLENKDVTAAFICSGPYVRNKEEFNVELLASPVMYGENSYYAYIIINKDSQYKKFEDLKNKKFAYTDPDSNTGCLVPRFMIRELGYDPDTFFSEYIYTNHHESSIEAVASMKVDGASVDQLVWEYLDKKGSEITKKTKIIEKSPPYGMPPFVVHPEVDNELKTKLRNVLINMHKNKYGKAILDEINIDKFVVPNDSDFDNIRKMLSIVEK